jgi:hypothetical protein
VRTSTYACGKAVTGPFGPLVNPLGKKIRLPAGVITLTQDNRAVCLSDLMDDVERFASTIETMVNSAYDANPTFNQRFAADVLVSATMKEVGDER